MSGIVNLCFRPHSALKTSAGATHIQTNDIVNHADDDTTSSATYSVGRVLLH